MVTTSQRQQVLAEGKRSKQLLLSAKVSLIAVDRDFDGYLQGLWILELMWECGEDVMLAEAWMALLPATWFLSLFLQAGTYSTTLHLIGSVPPSSGALTLSLRKLSSSRRQQFALSTRICKILRASLGCRSFLFSAEVLWMVLQWSDETSFLGN